MTVLYLAHTRQEYTLFIYFIKVDIIRRWLTGALSIFQLLSTSIQSQKIYKIKI